MSGGTTCKCKPRNIVVIRRNERCSAFDGYRVKWSPYSDVQCVTCGSVWRTKADYVLTTPNGQPRWAGANAPESKEE